jgi:hypothetical protein
LPIVTPDESDVPLPVPPSKGEDEGISLILLALNTNRS